MYKDLESVKEMQGIWRFLLEQRISLVCFKEGSDEIVGLNLLSVELKEEQAEEYTVRSN